MRQNEQCSPDISISVFHAPQETGVIELITGIQQKEFSLSITAADQPDLMSIPEFYQVGCGNFWTASSNGQVVGTIALLDIGRKQAALRKMFVHPSFRGKSTGTAQKLLKTLLLWSAQNEIQDIFLGTTPKFLAAHRFYEKNGFVEIPQSALPDSFPIMKVDTKFYTYNVAAAETDV